MSILAPPHAFAIVERGVYRSNMPHPTDMPFLLRLGLRTVVILSPEQPLRAVSEQFEAANVRVCQLAGTLPAQDTTWKPVHDEIIKEALELVLDRTIHPILLLCTSVCRAVPRRTAPGPDTR